MSGLKCTCKNPKGTTREMMTYILSTYAFRINGDLTFLNNNRNVSIGYRLRR